MPEDRLERKTYRKSPGRQYGYEYDPLQSRSGKSQSGSTASRSGVLLSQRPDPRRTRQLLRQSIIASRRLDDETLEEAQPELREPTMAPDRSRPGRHVHHSPPQDPGPSGKHIARTRFIPMHDEDEPLHPRYRANNGQGAASAEPYLPSARQLMHEEEVAQAAWPHQGRQRYVDPDLGIDEDEDLDDLEQETYDYAVSPRTRGDHTDAPSRASGRLGTRHLPEEPLEDDLYEEYIYDEDEALPPGLHVVKKPSSSRRNFLIGAGVVVAGGAAVGLAASQVPKSPLSHTIGDVNKQVNDAFNRGVSQGADQAKHALLASLDNIETFSLQGAIDAAILTRTAYDVFVSPIVKFGSAITADFLGVMLNSFKAARGVLAGVNQDNATLAAIQTVLQSWVDNVQNLPKRLNAIAATDLDGAQAYLHALQNKIQQEMKALNSTPTPQANPSPTQKKS